MMAEMESILARVTHVDSIFHRHHATRSYLTAPVDYR